MEAIGTQAEGGIAVQQRFVLPLVVALAVVFVTAGCTSSSSTTPLKLTAADSGSTKGLAAGQELVISLASNPTTGYRWAVDGEVPVHLEQVGEPTYSSESTLVGAGGMETWTFRGKSTGSGELRLKYWRSFEPTVQPADTFAVTVNVQ